MIRLVQDRLGELIEACGRHHVRRLSLFGSAVRGGFRESDSDLDFLVEFEPLPPAAHADCYFGLLKDLELLFQRPIDLLEREAIRNEILLQSVDESAEVVHEAA